MLKQKEWIEAIVQKTGCTKKDAKVYYDFVFDGIRNTIKPEENVKLSGFGNFKLRRTAAKEQVNLVSGEVEVVPEHNVVTFKPYIEIDPKPEAIELTQEEIDALIAAGALAPQDAEAVQQAREAAEKAKEEREARKAAEEAAKAAEEAAKAQEEPVEEAAAEEPAEELSEDEIHFSYEGKEISAENVRQVLRQKSSLSDDDIEAALKVVTEKAGKAGKKNVKLEEDQSSFNFVIEK